MKYVPGWTHFLFFASGMIFGVVAAFMGFPMAGPLIAILYLLPASIFLWDRLTTFVMVDDQGVSWRTGRDKKALSWDRISGCLLRRHETEAAKLFLIETESLESHELPVFSVPLFKAVARRRGRFRLQPARLGRVRSG